MSPSYCPLTPCDLPKGRHCTTGHGCHDSWRRITWSALSLVLLWWVHPNARRGWWMMIPCCVEMFWSLVPNCQVGELNKNADRCGVFHVFPTIYKPSLFKIVCHRSWSKPSVVPSSLTWICWWKNAGIQKLLTTFAEGHEAFTKQLPIPIFISQLRQGWR